MPRRQARGELALLPSRDPDVVAGERTLTPLRVVAIDEIPPGLGLPGDG
jgi:hypothetical protein